MKRRRLYREMQVGKGKQGPKSGAKLNFMGKLICKMGKKTSRSHIQDDTSNPIWIELGKMSD